MPDYKYLRTSGKYYVYENQNYIPYGFSYDYYMSYDFCDRYSKSNRSNLMLKAILLDDEQIEKYGYFGLYLFVAIPLPGTGAWTGSLIASLLEMKTGKCLLAIFLGVVTAGIIMSILSFGLIQRLV